MAKGEINPKDPIVLHQCEAPESFGPMVAIPAWMEMVLPWFIVVLMVVSWIGGFFMGKEVYEPNDELKAVPINPAAMSASYDRGLERHGKEER